MKRGRAKAQGTVSGMHGLGVQRSHNRIREFVARGGKEDQEAEDNGGVGRRGSFGSFPGGQKLLAPFAAAPNIAVLCSPL